MAFDVGIVSKSGDPSHKQKARYSLTEMGIALVPVLAQMGAWGRRFLPVSEELSIRAELLEKGGPEMWAAFEQELRSIHLGEPVPERSVFTELAEAYRTMVARKAEGGVFTI